MYVLLALVIGIWGYVIYSVFGNWDNNGSVKSINRNEKIENVDLNYYKWKDSLTYDSITRSPFTEDYAVQNTMVDSHSRSSVQNLSEPAYDPLAYAPAVDIQYLGYIQNEKSSEKIALLHINGKQYYAKIRERIDGFTLLSISDSEIKVKTDYQTINIPKK